ncbi:hypothetical protein NDU88_001367 [Pleurodeles waltl]|uniref:Uncharacterized protein n=1 Tax=Pleurodeles waltl TaxID=8319 RepID=A0AAV7P5A3_PLEWA|nr:hypothetical protein NDU88_001367 [Pleurodeles waltl]
MAIPEVLPANFHHRRVRWAPLWLRSWRPAGRCPPEIPTANLPVNLCGNSSFQKHFTKPALWPRREERHHQTTLLPPLTVQDSAVECILKEITSVSHRIEGLDSTISALAAVTKSIRLDIAGSQNRVTDLEQRVTTVVGCLNVMPDGKQELLFLRRKVIDLEDRSCRKTACFFGFPELLEELSVAALLRKALPTIKGLTFDPHWNFSERTT